MTIPLTSPDPQIQEKLDTNPALVEALEAYMADARWVTRRVMAGVWTRFLQSDWGRPFGPSALDEDDIRPVLDTTPVVVTLPAPEVVPAPAPVVHTNGHTPKASPSQADLFELLARGVRDHLPPQDVTLDEGKVQGLIDKALLTRSQVVKVLHQLQVKRQEEVLADVELEGELPYWFDRVYKTALCRVHQLLVGPRGCGKTLTAQLLAQALSLPLYTISLSQGVDEGVLQGWLLPVDEHMKFSYVRSKFVRAYEEGGVVLLDELDAADNNVLMIVHAALANGLWDIPLRGEGAPPLVRHDNFIVIAAANTHGHGADRVYVGRQQLDGATLDRFAMGRLEVDYDEEMERRAYRSVHAEIGQRLRARCRAQQGWTRDVSTRNIADAVKLSAQFSPEEAWFGYFADWKDGDLSKVGVVRDRKRMRVVVE